jgi:hypothetical protein
MIRLILARHIAKRGAPGSPRFEDIRRRQLAQVATPLHHQPWPSGKTARHFFPE